MSFWLLIIGALTLQEGLSTTVILVEAVHNHYSLLLIHAIWLFVTVAQTYLGYFLGKWIQKRFANTKAEQWFKKYAQKLDASIGKRGAELALILGGALVSPAATAFLASWLDLSLTNIMIFVVFGDFLWYLSEWVTVYGATWILADAKYGVIIVVALVIVWLVASRVRRSTT